MTDEWRQILTFLLPLAIHGALVVWKMAQQASAIKHLQTAHERLEARVIQRDLLDARMAEIKALIGGLDRRLDRLEDR